MTSHETSLHTPARAWWRRWRGVVIVIAIVLVATIILAIVSSQSRRGYLDAQGVGPSGARAVVQVLGSQEVEVTEVRTTADAAGAAGVGTTVVVTVPDLLLPNQVSELVGTGADLVLLAPGATARLFSDQIEATGSARVASYPARCDLGEAQRAGSARTGGVTYSVTGAVSACYRSEGAASVVVAELDHGGRLTVLGSPELLMNRFFDEDGNASLALGLLGHNPELVWYRPTLEELVDFQASLTDLLPRWVSPVAWQLAIAGLLAALWQARRLGRLVPENLPVVVRAAETTEGRARLYRRGRSRGHAAATVRDATTARLRSRLGLPRDAAPSAVAAAVAARTGRTDAAVLRLLSGPEPTTDTGLVQLTNDLDSIEQEVRTL